MERLTQMPLHPTDPTATLEQTLVLTLHKKALTIFQF